jgi:predicted ATP-binding protein involved in virulence
MRLVRLKMKNFRGFEKLDLEFHPKVTVLVGANGSGKTTVLEAVAKEIQYVLGSEPGFDWRDHRLGSKETTLSLVIEHEDQKYELQDSFKNGSKKPGTKSYPSFETAQLRTGPLPLIAYYTVNRHVVDKTPGSKDPRSWEARAAWKGALAESGARFDELFEWFREREDLENEVRRDDPDFVDPQLEAVRSSLEQLLPEYGQPRVRRPRFGNSGASRSSRPSLVLIKDEVEYSFDQLSEGERTTAGLVFDIARRLAIANPGHGTDPREGDGLVMIDEIDLHLHPSWQAKVIPSLRRTFPNLQFVVTTHSPIVLSRVATRCLRLLKDFSLVERPPRTDGRYPDSILSEVFAVDLLPSNVQEEIHQLARLIDEERTQEARKQLERLGEELGDDHRDLARLGIMLALLED